MLRDEVWQIATITKTYLAHVHNPEVSGRMSHVCPKDVVICFSWSSKLLNVVSTEGDLAIRAIFVGQEDTKDGLHLSFFSNTSETCDLLDERGESANITCGAETHNAAELVLLDVRGLFNCQEDGTVEAVLLVVALAEAEVVLGDSSRDAALSVAMLEGLCVLVKIRLE